MKVFILTEAGGKVGFGHLTRCAAVYHAFLRRGIRPLMLINGDDGIDDYIDGIHHEVTDWLKNFQELLSRIAGADIVFIDSYLADEAKYRDMASIVTLLACVDDYKRIRYPQGVVINGLIYAPNMKYPKERGVEYLLGTRYVFLRKAFWNPPVHKTREKIKNIFMTFGGSDFLDLAPETLRAVKEHFPQASKTIVISKFYQNMAKIKEMADSQTAVVADVSEMQMRNLMRKADMAVSASGQTLSELASLGIPGVAICVADNQRRNWKAWGQHGFLAVPPEPTAIVRGLKRVEDYNTRRKSSVKLRKSLSPLGTFAIADVLIHKSCALKKRRQKEARRFMIRKVNSNDCRDIWLWRNTHQARSASFHSDPIAYEDHEHWFGRKLEDPCSLMWMAQAGGKKIGYVRHDIDGAKAVHSVLLNPQFYGMGLGAGIIRAADREFKKLDNALRVIYAEIQDHHKASINAFQKAGYRLKERIVKNGKKAGVYQCQT